MDEAAQNPTNLGLVAQNPPSPPMLALGSKGWGTLAKATRGKSTPAGLGSFSTLFPPFFFFLKFSMKKTEGA